MPISDSYKIDLAFKKLGYGVHSTSTSKAGYEEAVSSLLPTYDTDIWAEASKIPAEAAVVAGVVELVSNEVLTQDTTVPTATVFLSSNRDFIPTTFGNSYLIVVKDKNGNRVFPGATSFFFDYTSGTLVFPQGITSYAGLTPPFNITGYKYVGKKGLELDIDKEMFGDINNLLTLDKRNLVSAINEIKRDILGSILVEKTYDITSVAKDETRQVWLNFESNCYIKGIQVQGASMRLKLFTKPLNVGGQWVYDSGVMSDVIWDVMEIPFIDETGNNRIYCELTNFGITQNFRIKIYLDKPRL